MQAGTEREMKVSSGRRVRSQGDRMQPPLVQNSLDSGAEASYNSYRMGYNDTKNFLTIHPKPDYTGCCNKDT